MAWNTPTTWAAGAVLTAAQLNGQLRDNMLELGGAWTSYTPTLTGVTLGNGTISGRRSLAGKLVHWSATLVLGSTSSVTGTIFIGLPVSSRSVQNRSPFGTAVLGDVSTGAVRLWTASGGGVTTQVVLNDSSGALANNAAPWAWAAGDYIEVAGVYEAA